MLNVVYISYYDMDKKSFINFSIIIGLLVIIAGILFFIKEENDSWGGLIVGFILAYAFVLLVTLLKGKLKNKKE